MDTVLQSALRKFISDEHIRNVLAGEWVDMFDNHCHKLPGIRGRIGVSAKGIAGHEIGLDLMEMQPGSAFPLHTHAGDHVMYVIKGRAICHVDGKDYGLKTGDSIFIPAEYPHGFACPADAGEPLSFVAVGHPHRRLSSTERMKLVERKPEGMGHRIKKEARTPVSTNSVDVITATELLDRFKKVTVWNRGGVRAPHKPLLLLWALGRVAQKKPRLTKFAAVEQPLRQLLMDFGPRRKSYHPEYPFWYLRSKHNSTIWEVEQAGELPLKKNHREPKIEELREASGGFLPGIYRLFEHEPDLIGQVAVELLNANFPNSVHPEILGAVGLHNLESFTHDPESKGAFTTAVLQAYEYRCAVCGYEASPGRVKAGLEAAHIKWPQAGGPDSIANGLCMCVMHRKAFDGGVLGISERGIMLVSEQARRSKGLDSWLVSYEGQPVQKPKRADWHPQSEFLAWHAREVFQGSGKTRRTKTRV